MLGTILTGDMQNVRLMMVVAAGLVLLATALAALDVPLAAVMEPWFSVEMLVGVGLVAALVAAFAGKWKRSRQRKMLRDMRDSALW